MHSCTIIGWTLDGAIYCDRCGDDREAFPRVGSACGQALDDATPADPGWHNCGESKGGSPCHATLAGSHDDPNGGPGDDICAISADSASECYGNSCDGCGAVLIGADWESHAEAVAREWTRCPACNAQAPVEEWEHEAGDPCISCGEITEPA